VWKSDIITDMSTKLFKQLIKRASQPIPKEPDKPAHPENYNEKQTHPRKTANT
jgi:hypothetical protein